MAYVDHAFSISDEDLMIGTSYTVSNRPPVKEISLAVALLVFGTLGIVSGFFMAYYRVGGDRGHGLIGAASGELDIILQQSCQETVVPRSLSNGKIERVYWKGTAKKSVSVVYSLLDCVYS